MKMNNNQFLLQTWNGSGKEFPTKIMFTQQTVDIFLLQTFHILIDNHLIYNNTTTRVIIIIRQEKKNPKPTLITTISYPISTA